MCINIYIYTHVYVNTYIHIIFMIYIYIHIYTHVKVYESKYPCVGCEGFPASPTVQASVLSGAESPKTPYCISLVVSVMILF